ncbi:hypothetical protein GCM10011375_26760 [Hymenobacter qilianensis]|uniref:Uncharacterized protein n=1 Tax=Hymenobacter qilianensis TaxID=1385715 RepID=A0ACB5PTH1_9BACT|nr:hypothetical protein GCM10011375_26760 [Hymenobacter qilianensis]
MVYLLLANPATVTTIVVAVAAGLASILAIIARPGPHDYGALPVRPYDNRLALYHNHSRWTMVVRPWSITVIRARRRIIGWSACYHNAGLGGGHATRQQGCRENQRH